MDSRDGARGERRPPLYAVRSPQAGPAAHDSWPDLPVWPRGLDTRSAMQPDAPFPVPPPSPGSPRPRRTPSAVPHAIAYPLVTLLALVVGVGVGSIATPGRATGGQAAGATASAPPAPNAPAPDAVAPDASASNAPASNAPVAAAAPGAVAIEGDGTYAVGLDLHAGTYTSTSDGLCYWARLDGVDGNPQAIIANSAAEGRQTVTIKASDDAFRTSGCGSWTRERPR